MRTKARLLRDEKRKKKAAKGGKSTITGDTRQTRGMGVHGKGGTRIKSIWCTALLLCIALRYVETNLLHGRSVALLLCYTAYGRDIQGCGACVSVFTLAWGPRSFALRRAIERSCN